MTRTTGHNTGFASGFARTQSPKTLCDIMKPTLLVITLLLIRTLGFSQTYCDTIGMRVFSVTEFPPKLTITESELELELNKAISTTSLDDYQADFLYVSFCVNCLGQDFNYTLIKQSAGLRNLDTISDFQRTFLSTFQSITSWTPAKFRYYDNNGKSVFKPVDYALLFILGVDKSGIHVLNDKEKLKSYKKKLKK